MEDGFTKGTGICSLGTVAARIVSAFRSFLIRFC